MEEEELGQDAENILTATRETNISPIQATLGPEQGESISVNDTGNDQINENTLMHPSFPTAKQRTNNVVKFSLTDSAEI
eukprot:4046635-Ditylum_brightwellii.AAC.1